MPEITNNVTSTADKEGKVQLVVQDQGGINLRKHGLSLS